MILKWQPFEYKAKFEKVFLTYFLKDCTKKALKISVVNENFKPVSLFPINGYPLNFLRNYKFCECTLLIANIVKGAVSGLGQLLATESPLKKMKNAFDFTLKALFILKIFKFLTWLLDHSGKQLD